MPSEYQYSLLIVDDNPQNRLLAVEQLMQQEETYKILAAPSAAIADKLLERYAIDLILLDWEMPGTNGISFLQKLKAHPQQQNIPVIMYTGIMTSPESLREALDAGAADFLRKPADPIELLARCRSILSRDQYYKALIQAEEERSRFKLQELSASLIQIAQQKRLLKEILDELVQLESHGPLLQLQQKIKHKLKVEGNWAELQNRIQLLHQEFINKLESTHPNITKEELIYCTLIYMGLDQKEIMDILDISPESALRNRYGLRQKMQLHSQERLEEYLKNI